MANDFDEAREPKPYWFSKYGIEAFADPKEPFLYPDAFVKMVRYDAYAGLKVSFDEIARQHSLMQERLAELERDLEQQKAIVAMACADSWTIRTMRIFQELPEHAKRFIYEEIERLLNDKT